MGHQRAVGLAAQKQPVARRHEQQTPVRQPVDTAWKGRSLEHDFSVALQIDGDDLWLTPVREPQPVLVPTRLLAEHDAGHQCLRSRHGATPPGRPRGCECPRSVAAWPRLFAGSRCRPARAENLIAATLAIRMYLVNLTS